MKRALRLAALFTIALLAFGQPIPGQYIVELRDDPAGVAAAGKGRLALAGARSRVQAAQLSARRAIRAAGAEVVDSVSTVSNALLVRLADDQVDRLRAVAGVKRVFPVFEVRMLLDHAIPLHRVPEAWARIGGQDLAGAGVKIAVIDSGLDETHPAFQDPTLAIPEGFPKVGREADRAFTNNKIIVARTYDELLGIVDATVRDVEGHGSAVAMTAAGVTNTGPLATITGVAPKAWLGNYKVFTSTGSSTTGVILKAIDDAVSDGMDVINLSLGTTIAYRPEYNPTWDSLERAASMGVIVVAAAGNAGPDPLSVGTPGDLPSVISVGATWNERYFAGPAVVVGTSRYTAYPGNGPKPVDAIEAPLLDVAGLDESGTACAPLAAESLTGKIALILRGDCYFSEKIANVSAAGALAAVIYSSASSPTPIIMDVQGATLPAMMIGYADGVAVKTRISETPDLVTALRFQLTPVGTNPNYVASFSSRGPTAAASIKPDLAAVGTYVYTATQDYLATSDMYDSSRYIAVHGTSFSSPLVAGAAALLKAARPGLTVADYRSLLINSATPLPVGESSFARATDVGSGVLNVDRAVSATILANPTSISFGVGGATVAVTRTLTIKNLSSTADTFTIAAVPLAMAPAPSLSTTTVSLDAGASQDIGVEFNPADLAAGGYQGIIRIQGTQGQADCTVPYWYAVSSGVPGNIRIVSAAQTGVPGQNITTGILFQITEASGVPVSTVEPTVTVAAGDGVVRGVLYLDAISPALIRVSLRLGPAPGDNVFRITAGDIVKDVVIPASY